MPLNVRFAVMLVIAVGALVGCDRSPPEASTPDSAAKPPRSAAATAPVSDPFDATWQGVFPCADCDGIQTRLRLIADGNGRRFELQETYLADESGAAFEAQGDWVEEAGESNGRALTIYRLDVNGSSRWFSLQPDGALEMREDADHPAQDGLAYRLQRM